MFLAGFPVYDTAWFMVVPDFKFKKGALLGKSLINFQSKTKIICV